MRVFGDAATLERVGKQVGKTRALVVGMRMKFQFVLDIADDALGFFLLRDGHAVKLIELAQTGEHLRNFRRVGKAVRLRD